MGLPCLGQPDKAVIAPTNGAPAMILELALMNVLRVMLFKRLAPVSLSPRSRVGKRIAMWRPCPLAWLYTQAGRGSSRKKAPEPPSEFSPARYEVHGRARPEHGASRKTPRPRTKTALSRQAASASQEAKRSKPPDRRAPYRDKPQHAAAIRAVHAPLGESNMASLHCLETSWASAVRAGLLGVRDCFVARGLAPL